MPLDKHPDAIIYPTGMFPAYGAGLIQANKVFGPVLGCRRVAVADQQAFNFARRHPVADDTPGLLFPEGHPHAKQERHAWFLGIPDGKGGWSLGDELESYADGHGEVLFGYLKADEFEDDDAVLKAIHGAMAKRIAARQAERAKRWAAMPEDEKIDRVHRLHNLGIIDAATRDARVADVKAGGTGEGGPGEPSAMAVPEPPVVKPAGK